MFAIIDYMKKGWLVRNSFIHNPKFDNLFEMLLKTFKSRDIDLEVKEASDLGLEVNVLKGNFKPDFVLFWDKDIYLARKLEMMGIRLFNSSSAVFLCDNKIVMYQELAKEGIRIPKTYIAPKTYENLGYSSFDFLDEIIKEIGFPFVIKEAYGSFGKQVYLANNIEEAKEIITKIWWKPFLIQEFIASSKGKDVRINVVGDKVIASMYRENNNDFRSNISNGGNGSRFEPNNEFKQLAIKAAKVIGCDFAGVDVLFGPNNEPIICELNSNPQFASTLEATGIDLGEFIADYILERI